MSRSDGSTADYYVLPEGATQLQDLISHRNLNAQLGEIFRACYRFGLADHSDQLRDAKKIRFYAQAEVERLEKLNAVAEEPSHIISDIPKGWIKWDGGSCPVVSGAYVYVTFRDANSPTKPVLASVVNWKHRAKPSRLDIVSYRIASQSK